MPEAMEEGIAQQSAALPERPRRDSQVERIDLAAYETVKVNAQSILSTIKPGLAHHGADLEKKGGTAIGRKRNSRHWNDPKRSVESILYRTTHTVR